VHPIVGGQAGRNLTELGVPERWDHTETHVRRAEFQLGCQHQHVINRSLGNIKILEIVATFMTWKKVDHYAVKGVLLGPAYATGNARCDGIGGAIIVAAAGNGKTDKVREFPAGESVHGLLSVGASDASGQRNYRGYVEFAAPSDGITNGLPGGGFATRSGTSMAAPLAAGMAVQVRAKYPRLSGEDVAMRLRERAAKLCDTDLRQVYALSALSDKPVEVKTNCH
jgi:subtilisin family serine protease